jgi:cytochrome c oxidase subunit IV
MGITKNPWRLIVAGILLIVWIAFSFLIVDYFETQGWTDWWILVIPVAMAWLLYIGFAYATLNENKINYGK